MNPFLIIDINDNDNDDSNDRDNTPILSIDENIDPQLNKYSSGKIMKGKRKTNDSDKFILIL
jgi:hypothetical protein